MTRNWILGLGAGGLAFYLMDKMLSSSHAPEEEKMVRYLDTLSGYQDRKIALEVSAIADYKRLLAAARSAGIAAPLLSIVSGYRTPTEQQKLWDIALKKYASAEEARKWVAPPGQSAHQTGRAVDLWLGFDLDRLSAPKMRESAAWKFLRDNARNFNFFPYDAEPWHWEHAKPHGTNYGAEVAALHFERANRA